MAVNAPIKQALTYTAASPLNDNLQPGMSVVVPLGQRTANGVLLEQVPPPKDQGFALKDIVDLHPERPLLGEHHLKWGKWLSNYYYHPVGEVFSLFFPPLKRKGRQAPQELFKELEPVELELTPSQKKIFNDIHELQGFQPHLLWGITGAGKTEIYIELIKECLKKGQGSILLLPEISLTPQLVSRLRNRIGDEIAVIHSQLTERQKTDQWWQAVSGEKKVLIGARSALFCPIPNCGLIVIDEEHEPSYKQEEKLKYHARDTALMLAKLINQPIVLGSATPSSESWQNVKAQKYHLHSLLERPKEFQLPEIEVVDLTQQQDKHPYKELPFWLSQELYNALEKNYESTQQSALFLNRRGIAQLTLCNSCGFVYECPNCEISLTLHGSNHLVCHYCQYSETLSSHCPSCRSEDIRPVGLGTEQVEQDMKRLFPMARVYRVDRDEMDSRQKLEEFIEKMENHEIDILVGTQMIAKGLDFKNLTLVGLVLADIGFNLPDFRATERSYQLITQMSGRAGRHSKGQVFIQTYKPDHPSITYALQQDTPGFLDQELVCRSELNYPPTSKMASIRISGLDLGKTKDCAQQISQNLKDFLEKKGFEQTQVLGAISSPLSKIRNRFRFQILLKTQQPQEMHAALQALYFWQKSFSRVRIQIDRDPYSLM